MPDRGAQPLPPWKIWVDTGGTFTDCLAQAPDGTFRRAKVLSHAALRATVAAVLSPDRIALDVAWDLPLDFFRGCRLVVLPASAEAETAIATGWDPATRTLVLDRPWGGTLLVGSTAEIRFEEEAPVVAARVVTRTRHGEPLPPLEMRLATTRGTNALLERRVAPVAFFVTRGFRDLLRIGTQQRPDLFALDIRRPEPLAQTVIEVDGRVTADGGEITPLDLAAVEREARVALDAGIRVAAVALLNSWARPEHERRVSDLLRRLGFTRVSASSALSPFIQLLPRAETAVVDACLGPVIRDYLEGVQRALGRSRLFVMTSAGGLASAATFAPKDSLLSGPAGGVVGAKLGAAAAGFDRVLAFDMGGTSTDVARLDGDFEYQFEHEIAGTRLVAPALAIESVAAGGGSICDVARGRLEVGPRSAGATPGPACYGAGGPLTITDVNLLLGRLAPSWFGIPITVAAAERALAAVEGRFATELGRRPDRLTLLEGFLDLANERMAEAMRGVSLRRGYDPRDYALLGFGGAGGQHACAVAERLGVSTVIMPPDAGLLSARGLGQAVIERFAERQVLRLLEGGESWIGEMLRDLAAEARAALLGEGVAADDIRLRRQVAELRFAGQDSVVAVEVDDAAELRARFLARHAELFGHCPAERAIELVSLRVVASSTAVPAIAPEPREGAGRPADRMRLRARGAWVDAVLVDRRDLAPEAQLLGPAIIHEPHGTTIVEPGWTVQVHASGALVLRHVVVPATTDHGTPPAIDQVIVRELFTSRFRAIALEMGETLRRTAVSTNIKERLDFSCALLDARGELVVNAPHIPVHLGALGLCVRELARTQIIEPGDVWVTNHPAFGGSHLPDVTVITPVHAPDGRLAGYVASRAHHAELGGLTPGSMPPTAKVLSDEGVVIAPRRIVRRGEWRGDDLREVLLGAPHPTRAVLDNLADLSAAVAANRRGAAQLLDLVARFGLPAVHQQMEALAAYADERLRAAFRRLPPGRRAATAQLDDGWTVRVAFTIDGERARIDFSGSSGVHPGSLNATPAIVRSCVIYVLRVLLDEPLPLNEGLMRPVELVLPPGFLAPEFSADPAACPAVVAGNTETSQCVVDALLQALGLCAGSQGTMNNVTFGTEKRSYYETVCGGAGAGPGFAGASGVHTHMTNTRITDPEILEHRYPVRIVRFALRPHSGGAGRFPGGDGVVREYEFLEPLTLTLVTQHRRVGPAGLFGGGSGAPGRQAVVRAGGGVTHLAGIDGGSVAAGDRLVLETPGGGGFGPPSAVTTP